MARPDGNDSLTEASDVAGRSGNKAEDKEKKKQFFQSLQDKKKRFVLSTKEHQ